MTENDRKQQKTTGIDRKGQDMSGQVSGQVRTGKDKAGNDRKQQETTENDRKWQETTG